MMCYKDRTFCRDKDCIKFNECYYALTDKIKLDAEIWWQGKDAPIAVHTNRLGCFKENK